MSTNPFATTVLTVDLDAVVANWRLLRQRAGTAICAAVVKADAYGLGATAVAPALAAAGCQVFYVATVDEGVTLRAALGDGWPDAEIHVLGGLPADAGAAYVEHRLIATLNSLYDVDRWLVFQATQNTALPANLHIDTGMCRLGLPPDELDRLIEDRQRLSQLALRGLISHLACADIPGHPLNRMQLERFHAARTHLPGPTASLANSSGIFLGSPYCFDSVRPGSALFGINPTPESPNPMAQVLRLQGKILQVRNVDTPQTVGYGATHRCAGPARLATVGVGYADGYPRSLSNSGSAYIGDVRVPIVGRVSMDLITLDVTAAAESLARPGMTVDLIGPHNPVDSVAQTAGTIGYEILTSLGSRYRRTYLSRRTPAE